MTNLPPLPGATTQVKAGTLSLISSSLLAALLLLGTGGLVDYLYGYKDSLLLEGTYVLLIVLGWLALFAAIVGVLLSSTGSDAAQPVPASGRGGLGHLLKLLGFGAGFLACIALMVGSLLFVEQQRHERIARLLATTPTATTTATVTELRARSRRGNMVYATLLTYQAGTEQVDQAIPGRDSYVVGQRVRVKYVVEHPDMFEVVD